jgi:hypothetical protein
VPFHRLVTLDPAGSAKPTCQVVSADEVLFVIVYWPMYPPSQELVSAKATAGAAALAPVAVTKPAPTASTVTPVPAAASLARPRRFERSESAERGERAERPSSFAAWLPMSWSSRWGRVADLTVLNRPPADSPRSLSSP